ncbi:MAG: hypothetical protein HFF55_01175 [Lawsonibacter sp.]|jgi:YbbR domain-containing protein|nr:hypothetical protein [Lawsonibacter sp.]MCI9567921.1 hypothetical protein [Lawsonibacter sp.]
MMGQLKESRWVFVLLSILLAIVFWFYVRATVDPDGTTSIHNVRVETTGANVLTSQGLTISSISPQTVELRVEGPTSVRTRLLQHRSSLYMLADVSRCAEGENVVRCKPILPENYNWDELSLTDQEPASLTVTVEKLYSQSFDVHFQLSGKVAKGYQMGTPAVEPGQVIVSGPVEQVEQVEQVAAILKTEELKERFAGDLPLVPLDKQGKPLTDLEITLSAETAYVVVPVVVSKTVELTVDVVAGGGAAAEDAKVDIEPKTIVVSGSEADLEGLEKIFLGKIDLSDVVGTNTFPFAITLDPRLENVSGIGTAQVTVTVEGLSTQIFAVTNIGTTAPPNGFDVSVVTQSVTVTVRGREEDLANIDASQLQIVADLSEVNALGSRRVPAKVYLNGTSTVGVVGDYTVVVDVE